MTVQHARRRIHSIEAAVITALQNELENARKHFPENTNLLSELEKRTLALRKIFADHDSGKKRIYAIHVYAALIEILALGVRLIEEGDAQYAYRVRPSGPDELPFGQEDLNARNR